MNHPRALSIPLGGRFLSLKVLGLAAGLALLGFGYQQPLVQDSLHDALRPTQVTIAGLHVVSATELQALLPLNRSSFSWTFDEEGILARVRGHPLVQRAVLSRCNGFSLRCFRVEVTERQVRYVAISGDESWLLGADGVVMGKAPRTARSDAAKLRWTVLLLDGKNAVLRDPSSADIRRAQMEVIRLFVALAEEVQAPPLQQIELLPTGDLRVHFKDAPYAVVFDAGTEAKTRTAFRRLTALLEELGTKANLVEEINLGLDRSAVVRWSRVGDGNTGSSVSPSHKDGRLKR